MGFLSAFNPREYIMLAAAAALAFGLYYFHHKAYEEGLQVCHNAANNGVITAQSTIQNTTSTLETETLDVQKEKGNMLPVSPFIANGLVRLRHDYPARK